MLAPLLLAAFVTPFGDTTPEVREPDALHAPFVFIENIGQWPEPVRFMARGREADVTVFDDGFVVRPRPAFGPDDEIVGWTGGVHLRFVPEEGGASGAPSAQGVDEAQTQMHFHLSHGSFSHARTFEQVRLDGVAPGIDVVLRDDDGSIAYDLHFEPQVAVDALAVEVDGLKALESSSASHFHAAVDEGRVAHRLGESWVDEGSLKRPVSASVELNKDRNRIGFAVEGRSLDQLLVIDPTVEFITFLGGGSVERDIEGVIDDQGRTLLKATSLGLTPTLPGSLNPIHGGGLDIWVGRLSADGSTLDFGLYLGTNETEQDAHLGLYPNGDISVIGQTWSDEFPHTLKLSTEGQILPFFLNDSFVCRLSPDGDTLHWSLVFGGAESDVLWVAGLGPDGTAYLVVESNSLSGVPSVPTFPSLPPLGFDDTFTIGDTNLESDRLVIRVAADGQSILNATWFPFEFVWAMDFDADGNVYFGGVSDVGLPTTPDTINPDGFGGYVVKFLPDLSDLVWGTYVPGGVLDVRAVAVDSVGAVHLAGRNGTENSYVHPKAFQTGLFDSSAGYMLKLSPHGSKALWATYLGIWVQDGLGYIWDVNVDRAGNPIAVGSANADGWPTTQDAFQTNFVGPHPTSDAALTLFDSVGQSLIYSTWVGGSSADRFASVATADDGLVALLFESQSPDLPTTSGAFEPDYQGMGDAAVAMFDFGLPPFEMLNFGLKGSVDQPVLVGTGLNLPGTPTRLIVQGAEVGNAAFHVVGGSEVYVPLFGGTLVPFPDLVLGASINSLGETELTFQWPDVPTGATLTAQTWVLDPAAPAGVQASNALRMIGQ